MVAAVTIFNINYYLVVFFLSFIRFVGSEGGRGRGGKKGDYVSISDSFRFSLAWAVEKGERNGEIVIFSSLL